MSNEFELPTEGIKIYSPQKGWQDQPQTLADEPAQSPLPEPQWSEPPSSEPEWSEPEWTEPQADEPSYTAEQPSPGQAAAHPVRLAQDQAAALAEVGGSLHALFEALQQPLLPANVIDSGPSWRDVADLSRFMEDRLAEREELLTRLRGLEDEIRRARGGLLEALRLLAVQEQRNLEAAQVRADVSAMAAQVIAQRFSDQETLGAPPR